MASWRKAFMSACQSSFPSLPSRFVSNIKSPNHPLLVVSQNCYSFSSIIGNSITESKKSITNKSNRYQFDKIEDALTLFHKMLRMRPRPSILQFNQLLGSIVQMKHYATVVSLCKQMEMVCIRYNHDTFSILINCFYGLGCNAFGYSVFGKSYKLGLLVDVINLQIRAIWQSDEPNIFTYNALMERYCSRNQIDEARKVFDSLDKNGFGTDEHSYNIMIKGYCKVNRIDEAMDLYRKMSQTGRVPYFIYCNLIEDLFRLGKLSAGQELLRDMLACGLVPNTLIFLTMVHSLRKNGHIDGALNLFEAMQNNGLKLGMSYYNVLIGGLCEAGKLKAARKLFSGLSVQGLQPNVCTYTSLIKGLCKEGQPDEAYLLFKKMEEDCCLPNDICYNMMIRGFLQNNDTSKAMQIHSEMVSRSFNNIYKGRKLLDHLVSRGFFHKLQDEVEKI